MVVEAREAKVVKEVKVEIEVPATLTTLPAPSVTSIGAMARGRGTVLTDTSVPGETTRAPSPDTTETSPLRKEKIKIENSTSLTTVLWIHYTLIQKYRI